MNVSLLSHNEWHHGNKLCMEFFFFALQNNSISPSESLRTASEKHRSSSDYSLDSKKRKVEEKDSMSRYVSRLRNSLHILALIYFEARPIRKKPNFTPVKMSAFSLSPVFYV